MAKERFLTVSVPIKDSDCTNSIPYASKAALKTAVPVSRDNVNKIYKVSYSIGGDTIVEYYRYIPKIAQNDYTKVVDREFPSLGSPLEILDFTYDATRMGQAPSISAQNVMWYADKDESGNDVTLEDLWSQECHVTFNGENFYLKQIPTSSKSNEDARYRYDLDFVAERVVLETTYLYDVVQPFITARPISESAVFNFYGDVYELAKRINASLIKSGLATLTRKYVKYSEIDEYVPYLTYEQWNQVFLDYNVLLDTTDIFADEQEAETFRDEVGNDVCGGDYNIYLMEYIYANTDGVYDLTGYQCRIGKNERGEDITSEEKLISFQKNTIHEALQRVFDDYKLQYYIEKEKGANGEFTGNTSIWIADAQHDFADWNANTQDYVRNDDGIPTTQHPLDYGIDDALLSKEKANNTEKIITRITGAGSTENIPWYYPNPTADGWIAPIYKRLGSEENVIIDYPTSEGSTPADATHYEKYLKNRIGNNFRFGLVRDLETLALNGSLSSSTPDEDPCYTAIFRVQSVAFELLTEQPDDWETNYGNYYKISRGGNGFEQNTNPTFSEGKYYKRVMLFTSVPKFTLEYVMGGSGSNYQSVQIELRDSGNVLRESFDSNTIYPNPQGFKKMCRDHDGATYYLAYSHDIFKFQFDFKVSSFPLSRIVDYEGYLKTADNSILSTSQFDYTMDYDERLENGTIYHHYYGREGYVTCAYIGANFYQRSDLVPYAVFEDHIGYMAPDPSSRDFFVYHEPICVECGYSMDGTAEGAVSCIPRVKDMQYRDLSTSEGIIYKCKYDEQPNPATGGGGDFKNVLNAFDANPVMGAKEWFNTFLDLKLKMYDSDSWYLGYKAVSLADYGIALFMQPDIFDTIEFKRVKYITPQPNLMPEVYIKTDGEQRFYNAHNYWDEENNSLFDGVADANIGEVQSGSKVKNPLYKENESDPDNKHYEFENEYIQARPHEHIEDFEDIKPTITGQTNYIPVNVTQDVFNSDKESFYYNNNGTMVQCTALSVYDSATQYYAILRIDVVDTFGYDLLDSDEIWESSDDGTIQGEYKHPYFFARLRPLGFNIFDLALQSDMVLSMTSGHCGACNFKIAVDENTNKNPVQLWEYDVYEGTWNGKTLKFYAGDLRRYVDTSNLYYDTDGTSAGYKKVTDYGTLEGSDGWLVNYGSTTHMYRRYTYSAEQVAAGFVGNAKGEAAIHFEEDVVTSGRFIESQQDTTENFVWVALTKDTDSYGVIMPSARPDYSDDNLSVYIRPNAISDVKTPSSSFEDDDSNADKFVFVNIRLPQMYLRRAERELSRKLIAHMYENNYQKFNFSAKFSRIFLAQNANMESLLNENSVMYISFNNRTYRQYAKHYAYKMTHDDVLPEVTVDMNDSLPLSRTFEEQQQVAQFQQSQLFKQQIAASSSDLTRQIMARTIGRNSNTIIGGNIISGGNSQISLIGTGDATRKNQENIGTLRDSMENDYYKRKDFVVENGTDLNIGNDLFLPTSYKNGGRMQKRTWSYATNSFIDDDEQTFAPTFYDSDNSQFVYYCDVYELLATEPADWDDANGKYYELTNGIYVPITWEETFVANTYYKKTEQEQTVTPITSSDLTSALIIQVLGYTPYDAASLDTDVNALINEQVYYVDTIGEANTIHIGESVIHLNDYALASDLAAEVLVRASTDTTLSTRIDNEVAARIGTDTTLQNYIDLINGKIPSAASMSNQLADKAYVTSAIASATSDFKGSWATWAAVPTDGSLYPVDSEGGNVPKTNDYMVVAHDETHGGATWRYKYSGVWSTNNKNGWIAEYMVSDAPLTSDQLAAINSGITSDLVAQIGVNQQDILALDDSKQNTITGAASTVTTNDLDSNLVLISNGNGKIAVSTITTTTLAYLIGLTGNVQQQINALSGVYQPLDADLTAIAALTGTTGFLVKTAADTWELDTNTYVTMSGMQIYLAANYVSQSSLATTLADYVLETDLAATLDNYALKSSLARVATTGSYTDLKNRPSTFTPSPHTHPWGQITVKPTTISGYGITDAKIVNGTIRLGNDAITPLTQHQSLANYVTISQLNTALAGYDPMYGTASGSYSHAIGRASTASGQYALALASNSTASANYAVALGSGATASAASAFALGNSSVASANYAVSFGGYSVASGQYSLATGRASYAMSASAVVTATSQAANIATETLSSAISNSRTYTSTVTSDLSVGMVVLDNADVQTPLAVITGINRTTNVITLSNNVTVASGVTLAYRRGNAYNTASVAEGYQTASIGGYGSHAEGRFTTAQGQASHAEGYGTWASVAYQHAVGKWNATGNFAEVVGNGTSEMQRSNIRTLDWNGNEWVAGNITAGGYIDATAIKIGGTIINVANAWMQGTATASNVIWVETSGTDYILHIGTTSITVSATGTATSIAWSGITGVPLTLTSLGNLSGTSNYGFLKLSSANTITVDTTSYALAAHTHTISDITDFPSLAAVATSGSYNDLTNKPDIPTVPTVNDATLTLQLNNGTLTNSVTFTANSATDQTFSVDLSSYLTSHQTIYALNLSAGAYNSGTTTYSPTTAALSINIPTSSDHLTEGDTNLFFTSARAAAYMRVADFTQANVYNLFSNARKYALDSGITSVKVSGYDSHLANTTVHITAGERTAWNAKADAATTLGGYHITDAEITTVSANVRRITLGNEHVDIDTSGVASLAWSAITGKPDIIAGTNGLESLNNTTTYGLLKYSGTNKIEVDTTSYTTMAAVEAKGYLTSAVTSINVNANGALGLEFVGTYPITSSGTIALALTSGYSIPLTATQQNWNSAYSATQNATWEATTLRLVKRDQYGNFKGNVIEATSFVGNATSATTATYLGDNNVGTATQPMYLDSGEPKASDATVGSATRPMYLNNGVMTATTFSLNKTVPADAVFSYSAGVGLKLTSTTFAVDYGSIASGNTLPVSGGAIYTYIANALSGYVLASNLATVATSGSYADLTNKPAINDGTLTLQVNGTTVTTFSANSSENVEFNVNTSGGGGGSVTSVAMTVPTGFTINGSPITSDGTLILGYANGYALPSQDDRNLWNSAYNDTLAATKENTPLTIVKRDENGNFAAGTITANLTGTASEATKLGHTTVGSGVKFIYLDRGEAKASASSLGGANQPIWLDGGQFKQCNTFAPASHTHDWRYDITYKPNTLDGYGITDAYTKTYIDNHFAAKATSLEGYGITDAYTKTQANNVFAYKLHTHTVSDITDLTLADVATSGLYSDLDGIPETFAPSAHTHNWSDILPASRPTTLAGYGLQDDAYITPEQDGYVTIRLGENSVVIDTSGTVSSVDWVAINNKPPIIAGPNGLASLSGTTTYGILKLTGTNEIQVDTTNYANQNAWSSVKIGNTTISAGSVTDMLTLVAGSNVTLTPNALTKTITLAATDTTYDDATQTVHGLMSTADKTKLDGIAANANFYELPTASASTLGGVKTGYTATLDKYYAVRVDASGNMYVNVPWSGGTYELPVAGDDTLGGVKTGYSMPSSPSNRYYAVDLDVNDKMFVEVPWENTTYTQATHFAEGLMSAADKTKLDGIAANANNYSLPTADDNTLGGVKTGYIDNDKNYRVQLDNNNRMFVTVDWQNTEYTLPEATSLALGGVKIGYIENGKNYPVQLDNNGKMFVSVPWTDTPYLLPLATGETLGGVKIGYTTDQSQRKYAVKLDNEKMYVEVPWTDTTYQKANDSTLGLVKIGYTNNGKNYKVQLNPSGQMFVNVDWTDTNTTYSAGTGLTLNNNNTFAVDFGTITNGGTKAVTGGVIYSQLTTKTDFLPLNADCLVIAHDMHTVMSSNFMPVTSSTTWNPNNDNYLPTMKGISAYVTGLTGNFAKYSTELTTGRLVAAAGSDTITSTNFIAAASSETWDINSDLYIPTMKGISSYVTDYVASLGYTTNTGTVTSITVKQGSGITVTPNNTAITTSGVVTITNAGVINVTTGSALGTIQIAKGGTSTPVAVNGLDTAAYKPSTYFATASHKHSWSDILPLTLPTTLDDYGITDAYTKSETYSSQEIDTNFYDKTHIDAMLANLGVMTFKGSVQTVSELPADASSGDVYVVEATGTPYVWDGTQWIALTLVDLSGYVTQQDIANMVTAYYGLDFPAGELIAGYNNTKQVVTTGKTILMVYSGATDFTNASAANKLPTASVINSYLSAAYQPIGSYVTETALQTALSSYVTDSDLSQALSSYVTLTYLETNYVTQAALSQTLEDYVTDSDLTQALSGYVQSSQIANMVTTQNNANLQTNRIVLGNSGKIVKDSGVRILSSGTWSSSASYVPTTGMTDNRYAVKGTLTTNYLATASSNTTVSANTYQPLTSTGLWNNSDGYIPTAARISSYITSLIGSTLQGYNEELKLLTEVNKNNVTVGYMYWNGLSYELADVQGGGDGNVSASDPLTNNCIVLGAGGYNIQPSTAQIVSSTQGWGDTNGNVATIGGICNYLSANYQPLNTNLTGISNLSSSGSGYLYYNGETWSFATPSGTGNVTAASTLTSGKLVTGVGGFGIATTSYSVANYGTDRISWDGMNDYYVPTMKSIEYRLMSLKGITFSAGNYNNSSNPSYHPVSYSGSTIYIPTNTSHLTDGSNIVMRSELSNYQPLDSDLTAIAALGNGTSTGYLYYNAGTWSFATAQQGGGNVYTVNTFALKEIVTGGTTDSQGNNTNYIHGSGVYVNPASSAWFGDNYHVPTEARLNSYLTNNYLQLTGGTMTGDIITNNYFSGGGFIGSVSLGTRTNPFRDLHVGYIYGVGADISNTNSQLLLSSGKNYGTNDHNDYSYIVLYTDNEGNQPKVGINGHILSLEDGYGPYDIGDSTRFWNTIYVNSVRMKSGDKIYEITISNGNIEINEVEY